MYRVLCNLLLYTFLLVLSVKCVFLLIFKENVIIEYLHVCISVYVSVCMGMSLYMYLDFVHASVCVCVCLSMCVYT